MSQQTYEIILSISSIFKNLIQILIFWGIWKVVLHGKTKNDQYVLFGILLVINIAVEYITDNTWQRYIWSAALVMVYIIWKERWLWKKSIFSMLLFYNFHTSSFLLAYCAYEYFMEYVQKDIDVYATDYMLQIYFQAGIGQIGLITLYAVIMLFFYFIFRIIGKNMPQMGLLELIFLSVLNVVGIILTYMVTDLSIVRLDNDVFLLFENQHQMFWKIPTMVCLLMVGEFSLIGVWKNYRKVLVEWQKTNAMEEQLKQMKSRYEEVGTFYSDIRKMRHEMRNHMMNIKGLVASEKYSEVGSYIEKMDESLCKIDFKYSTGNPLCDVIINDKLVRAERLNIACNVRFVYQETNTISTFDFGIILSNLLDNAIEACEKVIEGKRFIDLELSVNGSFLLLKVENSYDGHLVWDSEDKLPISTKGNTQQGKMLAMHGLGLENVSELADKYLGGVKIEEDKGIFRIIVMLQK